MKYILDKINVVREQSNKSKDKFLAFFSPLGMIYIKILDFTYFHSVSEKCSVLTT